MDSDRSTRARRLLERVRDLSEQERTETLDRECRDDPELRDLVLRRLSETAPTIALSEPATTQASESEEPRPGTALRAGQRFGGYRLERLLGTGGFAQVWEAADETGGRHVALKVLDRVDASAQAIERFEREGKLAAKLNHARSVYVFGASQIEGRPVIAMEVAPAGSLEDRLRREGALPCTEAVDRILEVLEGLEAAHELGIVHRDVKPSNCFIDADGRAKIGDFGISRSLDLDTTLTATGGFVGTPQYASPEQVRGDEVDARTDLYSLGCTLYALLTGKPPFGGDRAGKVLSQILTEPPAAMSACNVRVPRGLERVVRRLLQKDPQRRYADCAAARAALVPYSSRGLTIAGIAGRPGTFLLDDLMSDAILAGILTWAGVSLAQWSQNPSLAHLAVAFAIKIAWFGSFEGTWGTTPGKRLLGLRVTGLDGQRAPAVHIFLRSVVFFAGVGGPVALAVALDLGPTVRGFAGLFGYLIVLCTMRSSNGFAGVHELASGTRVMRPQKATRPEGEQSAVVERGPLEPLAGEIGAYRLQGRIACDGNVELLLATDDALGREVWIRSYPAGAAKAAPWDVNRPGRLRRLQRGREDNRVWEAYEDLGGASLRCRVASRGTFAWDEARTLLAALVEELRVGSGQGDLPDRLSLDHLWVDAAGQLRLLDFPVRESDDEEPCGDHSADDWRPLVQQFMLRSLEGRCVQPHELGGRSPRAPLPEHARLIVERVCAPGADPPTLGWLQEQLRSSASKPVRVTRRTRAFALALPTALALPLVLGMAVGVAHDELRNGALVVVAKSVQGTCAGVAIAMAFAVVPALMLTPLLRGGPWLWAFGNRIQVRDGRPASRLRCMYRGLIAYSPALWTAAFLLTLAAGDWAGRADGSNMDRLGRAIGYPLGHSLGSIDSFTGWVTLTIPGALFVAAAIQALIRPERGPADYVAGTRLVPR